MAGPWEKYQKAQPDGPWKKYGTPDKTEGVVHDVPGSTMGELGRGLLEGGSKVLTGITDYLPGNELPGLPEGARTARRQARQDLEQQRNEKSQSWSRTIGRGVGEAAPYFIPGPGQGAAIGRAGLGAFTRLLPTVAPSIRAAAGRFAANPAYAARQALTTRLGNIGSTLGDIVERAAMGAGIGAAQDPQHPGTGAMAGAAGGAVGPVAGAVGRAAGPVAGHVAQKGLMAGTVAAGHAMGFPLFETVPASLVFSRYSPLGQLVYQAGKKPTQWAAMQAARSPGAGPFSLAATKGAKAFEGDDEKDKRKPARPPERERAPVQPGRSAPRSAGSSRERDNDSAKDQRPDRRWADPGHFSTSEGRQ